MSKSSYQIDNIRKIYAERVNKFGEDPRALYWKGLREQLLRLEVLIDIEPQWGGQSVLDVGCGFCDLYEVLKSRGFYGHYTGVDITDEVLQIARKRHPDLQILNRDILREPFRDQFDYVIASGTFNIKFCNEMSGFVIKMMEVMFEHSNKGVAVNYLSTYVDFQHPEAHHTDPGWIFDKAKKLTKRILLRHDYMPYEFTFYLFKDDHIRPGNVFATYVKKIGRES